MADQCCNNCKHSMPNGACEAINAYLNCTDAEEFVCCKYEAPPQNSVRLFECPYCGSIGLTIVPYFDKGTLTPAIECGDCGIRFMSCAYPLVRNDQIKTVALKWNSRVRYNLNSQNVYVDIPNEFLEKKVDALDGPDIPHYRI